MKRILLICLCFLALVGCKDKVTSNNQNLTDEEINRKYEKMKNKLIEYGKMVYENDQWLNDDAMITTSTMTLKDLSEINGYDISMFVNPKTGEQCDEESTKIEFIISDVSDKDKIVYEFNPVLECDGSISVLPGNEIENEIEDESYEDLHNILVGYMRDIYDNDKWMNGKLEPNIYKVSLLEFKQKGYDISMFVNPETGEQCDLNKTCGKFQILGTTKDGKTDYKFVTDFSC